MNRGSGNTVRAIQTGLAHGLIGRADSQTRGSEAILYAEEFLDIYEQVDTATRALLFPLIDPEHYKRTYGVECGLQQVLDFVTVGPMRRKWPHPLVRFDFACTMRPDLAEDLADTELMFDLLARDLISLSPWLSSKSTRALQQLIQQELEPEVLAWIEPDYLRAQSGLVGDDWATILHFASVQDADFLAPSTRFDPHIWAKIGTRMHTPTGMTGKDAPRLPFLDYVWVGRLEGFSSIPVTNIGYRDHDGLVQYSDSGTIQADERFDIGRAANPHPDSIIALPSAADYKQLAVVLHLYYVEMIDDILQRLRQTEQEMTLFVTTVENLENQVRDKLRASGLSFRLYVGANRGRDIAPFLKVLPDILADKHDVLLKLHTKKSAHRDDGTLWGNALVEGLTDPLFLTRARKAFAMDPELGFVGPAGHALLVAQFILDNAPHLNRIINKLGLSPEKCRKHGHFFAGSMFFARPAALEPLLTLGLSEADFEPEAGQVDGTLAHAVERVFMMAGWPVNQKMLIMGNYAANQLSMSQFYLEGGENGNLCQMTQPARAAAGADEKGLVDLLRPFFDPVFYAEQLDSPPTSDPLLHYLREGWRRGLDPSRGFSSRGYLASHPDVAGANINPLLHYVENGRAEGRATQPAGNASAEQSQQSLEADMTVVGPHFDASFYQRSNPDVVSVGADPLRHFCETGWREKRDPHPGFSIAVYLHKHPELRQSNKNPFVHLLTSGHQETLRHMQYAPATCRDRAPRKSQMGRAELDVSGYMSPLLHQYFDDAHYRAHLPEGLTPYDAVLDYIEAGDQHRPSPSPLFDRDAYLARDSDGAQHREPAFLHHLRAQHRVGPAPDQHGGGGAITLDAATDLPLHKTQTEAERIIRFATLMKSFGTDNHALGQLDRLSWPKAFRRLWDVAIEMSAGKPNALTSDFNDTDAKQLAQEVSALTDHKIDEERLSFGQLLQVEPLLVWAAEKLQSLSDAELNKWVTVSGLDLLQDAHHSGRPVFLVGSHVGPGWSWLVALTRLGLPILNLAGGAQAVTMGPNYRHVTVDPKFPAASLARVSKMMEQGSHILHMLPDDWVQNGRKAVFLGRERTFAEGFCFLAQRFRPILLTIEGQQLPDGALNLVIAQEIGEVPDAPNKDQVYETLVQRYSGWVQRLWQSNSGDVASSHLTGFINAPMAQPKA